MALFKKAKPEAAPGNTRVHFTRDITCCDERSEQEISEKKRDVFVGLSAWETELLAAAFLEGIEPDDLPLEQELSAKLHEYWVELEVLTVLDAYLICLSALTDTGARV